MSTTSELAIALALAPDVPALAVIFAEATELKVRQGDNAWGRQGWSEQAVRQYMAHHPLYAVRQGDTTIGAVSLQWEDPTCWGPQPPDAGYLHRLAIRDGYRGQNLGAQVIAWVNRQIDSEGRRFLRLDCPASNARLQTYYERQGFMRLGDRLIPEWGNYLAALYQRPVRPER